MITTLRDGTTVRYLSCAETATEVRRALKAAYPLTRFAVKSKVYSGGASINVQWAGGPDEREVNALVDPFRGSNFDGMQDLMTSRDPVMLRGERVRHGANFIFVRQLGACAVNGGRGPASSD